MPLILGNKFMPFDRRMVFNALMDPWTYQRFTNVLTFLDGTPRDDGALKVRFQVRGLFLRHDITLKLIFNKPDSIRFEQMEGPLEIFSGTLLFKPEYFMKTRGTTLEYDMEFEISGKLKSLVLEGLIHRRLKTLLADLAGYLSQHAEQKEFEFLEQIPRKRMVMDYDFLPDDSHQDIRPAPRLDDDPKDRD